MSNEKTPIIEALSRHMAANGYPCHTPGHKQGRYFWPPMAKHLGEVFQWDLTELPGLDDLHLPRRCIRESSRLAAELFGVKETFYLVQGATVGIQAAILALSTPGGKLILPRSAHRSAYAGLVLGDLMPEYLLPRFDAEWGFPLPLESGAIKELPELKQAAALLLAPTYEGLTVAVGDQVAECKAKELPVIVDEAHGAHFLFSERFPQAAVTSNADVVVHGSHKTLPVLTQAAMAHVVTGDLTERMAYFLDLLQTTSPSYLLLAALDGAQALLREKGHAHWEETIEAAQKIRKHIGRLTGLDLLDKHQVNAEMDVCRIVLRSPGIPGERLRQLMREVKLEAEMYGLQHVVIMITPADRGQAVETIERRLTELAQRLGQEGRNERLVRGVTQAAAQGYAQPRVVLSPRQAVYAAKRAVAMVDAVGEVVAEPVIPYPPGIPLLWPGECLTPELFQIIQDFIKMGIGLQGTGDSTLRRIQILS